jgi:hypothetical protein
MTAIFLMLTLLLVQAAPVQAVRGSIQGIVKPPDAAEGIPDVSVILSEVPSSAGAAVIQRSVLTDTAGRFSFTDLPFSRYNVLFRKDGYFGTGDSLLSQVEPRVLATISQGAPKSDLTMTLNKGGLVTGMVRNRQGQPAAGIPIVLMRAGYQDGRRISIPGATGFTPAAGAFPITNDRGEYRLFWFPPGDYYVRTDAPQGARVSQPSTTTLLPTYYPGTTDIGRAVAVSVRPGREVAGIDFEVDSAPSFSIAGQVKLAVPASQNVRSLLTFYVIPRGGSPAERFPVTANAVNASGVGKVDFDFLLQGIAPGVYDVYPIFAEQDPTGAKISDYFSARIPVEVVDRNVTDLKGEIRPYPGVEIRSVLNGAPPLTPVPQPLPQIQLRPVEALAPLVSPGQIPSWDADRKAILSTLFPGKYKLLILGLPAEYYLADIRVGQNSVLNDALVNVSGEQLLSLEVVLSTGGGQLRGLVHDSRGQAATARIALVPQGPRRENPSLYRRTTAQTATGQFQLTNIAPGEYKVFAFERLPAGADESAEFLEKYQTRGRLVTIASGRAVNDLRLDLIVDDGR